MPQEPILLRAGDHIRVRRSSGLPYWHHGIVVRRPGASYKRYKKTLSGKNQYEMKASPFDVEVLHFVKTPGRWPKGQLMVTPFEDFKRDSTELDLLLDGKVGMLPRDEVEHRAMAHEGLDQYHLLGGNCEHFSTWCATGHWISPQIADKRNAAAAAVLIVPAPQLGVALRVLLVAVTWALAKRRPSVRPCCLCRSSHDWTYRADGSEEFVREFQVRLTNIQTAYTDALAYLQDPARAERTAWDLRQRGDSWWSS